MERGTPLVKKRKGLFVRVESFSESRGSEPGCFLRCTPGMEHKARPSQQVRTRAAAASLLGGLLSELGAPGRSASPRICDVPGAPVVTGPPHKARTSGGCLPGQEPRWDGEGTGSKAPPGSGAPRSIKVSAESAALAAGGWRRVGLQRPTRAWLLWPRWPRWRPARRGRTTPPQRWSSGQGRVRSWRRPGPGRGLWQQLQHRRLQQRQELLQQRRRLLLDASGPRSPSPSPEASGGALGAAAAAARQLPPGPPLPPGPRPPPAPQWTPPACAPQPGRRPRPGLHFSAAPPMTAPARRWLRRAHTAPT